MKRTMTIALLIVLIALLSACLAGPNRLEKTADHEGKSAGFFLGFWHGLLAPISFVVSVFSDGIHFYEVHNNGNWYNFGFVLGAGLFLSGGILGSKKKKK